MSTVQKREEACICASDYTKRNKPDGFSCRCSARVIQAKYLADKQVLIKDLPLTESYKLDLSRVKEVARNCPDLSVHLYKFAEQTSKLKSIVSPPRLEVKGTRVTITEKEVDKVPISAKMAKITAKTQDEIDKFVLDAKWKEMSAAMIENLGDAVALDVFLTKGFFRDYEYQGFDVVKFRDNFMKLCAMSVTSKNTVWNGDRMVEIHGEENFIRLVSYFVSMFNLRGNNIDKVIEGLEKPEAKSHLQALRNILSIRSKVIEKNKPHVGHHVTK